MNEIMTRDGKTYKLVDDRGGCGECAFKNDERCPVSLYLGDSRDARCLSFPDSSWLDVSAAWVPPVAIPPTEYATDSSPGKPTNPKDLIGSTKLPLNLVPDSVLVYAAMAFAEGASKYGAFNWRGAGVRASIYKAAHDRHMSKWWNGEECDPVTKVPHLASAIACLGIVADAKLCGKLTDDRPPRADVDKLIKEAEVVVAHLFELHKDKSPHHWTIADEVDA